MKDQWENNNFPEKLLGFENVTSLFQFQRLFLTLARLIIVAITLFPKVWSRINVLH